eukprot:TRINITY_DN78644_c0_g1_i1.p1 TRINITY_DN78644_c0_g1~~TRINITY_DN78644_c0_g1_i1.p1  ORF type:complete len:171 (+),score=35.90 TRINITY_DN78644_c0_g1_i1:70-513(+)
MQSCHGSMSQGDRFGLMVLPGMLKLSLLGPQNKKSFNALALDIPKTVRTHRRGSRKNKFDPFSVLDMPVTKQGMPCCDKFLCGLQPISNLAKAEVKASLKKLSEALVLDSFEEEWNLAEAEGKDEFPDNEPAKLSENSEPSKATLSF